MALQLSECADSDMSRVFEIISDAFGHEHPYIEAAFPDHMLPSGRAAGAARMLDIKHTDPDTTFLKVTNETGEIIAIAKWNVHNGSAPEEVELGGDHWATSEEKELAQILFREYLRPRRSAIRASGGNIVVLDILTVDPLHQRRGAGRMLVRWGTDVADKLGVQAVVEASKYGRPLYASEGFEFMYDYCTTYPKKWVDKEGQRFAWMVRPAKKK